MWAKTIQWLGNKARLIDQRKLPKEEVYVDITTPEEMYDAIKSMLIRGAPAIGVAAGYGIALAALNNCNKSYIKEKIELMESARPTAYNLFYVTNRMKKLLDYEDINASMFISEAVLIHKEDKELTEKLGEYGASLIPDQAQCMTICNAGALATGGIGTALAVFYKAKEKGKKISVFVPETRPFLQGARLTAWELKKNGIESILIADSAISHILKTEKVDSIFIGADRIARNGDTANKIGTYGLSLAAKEHQIPFFVVAPSTTFDLSIKNGKEIPIEERGAEELIEFGGIHTAPENIKVRNPAFDVTPNYLIKGIITEKGIIYPPFEQGIKNALH
jgi:methylthioribose-1-phosphate isomerase